MRQQQALSLSNETIITTSMPMDHTGWGERVQLHHLPWWGDGFLKRDYRRRSEVHCLGRHII